MNHEQPTGLSCPNCGIALSALRWQTLGDHPEAWFPCEGRAKQPVGCDHLQRRVDGQFQETARIPAVKGRRR